MGRRRIVDFHGLRFEDMIHQRGHTFSTKPPSVHNSETILWKLNSQKSETGIQNAISSDFFYDWFSNKKNRILLRTNLLKDTNRDKFTLPSLGGHPEVAVDINRFALIHYSKTFEWYVSELLMNELKFISSGFGVTLEGAPGGGDFDVIGFTINELVYIETKAGKPSNIESPDFFRFISRSRFLSATISIMYIDFDQIGPHLNFKDFLTAIGADELYEIKSKKTGAKLYHTMFSRIYILDNFKSSGSVENNLRFLFQTHYALEALLKESSAMSPKGLNEDVFDVKEIIIK